MKIFVIFCEQIGSSIIIKALTLGLNLVGTCKI